jgi:hypothetical protein
MEHYALIFTVGLPMYNGDDKVDSVDYSGNNDLNDDGY